MAYTTVTLNAGVGGNAVATDRISSKDYQLVKLTTGGEGVATEVSTSNPVPMSDAGGSLTVDNSGTFAVQATQSGAWNITGVTTVAAVTTLNALIPGTGATNLGKALASTPGTTDTGVDLLVIRKDSLATLTQTDGQRTHLRVNSLGQLHVTGAAGTQYTVDAVAGASDTGTVALVKRVDTLSTITPANGDYTVPLVDSTGALWVNVSNGISAVADDAAFTVGTTPVLPVGFLADESASDSVNEGDVGAGRMTLDRYQRVAMTPDGDQVKWAGVNCPVKRAVISASSSGNNTIVAAVSGKKFVILAVNLISNGTVNAKWQTGASGTDITGLAYMVANTGYILPFSPHGYFETGTANTLLNLNLSGAVAVGGCISYIEIA